MASYKCLILVDLKDGKGLRYFGFDKLDSKRVSARSNITTHPLINGDTIADHMYRDPITFDVSGSFALSGSKGRDLPLGDMRLTEIQDIFEKIKDEGILCDIITQSTDDNSTTRFKVRKNMALTSISWTEYLESMDFSFSFTEVITLDVKDITYSDSDSEDYPNVTDAQVLSFADTLLDTSELKSMIMEILINEGLVSQEFIQNYVGAGLAIGAGIFAGGIATLGIILASEASAGPPGWIAAAITAEFALVGFGIYYLVDTIIKHNQTQEYRIAKFTEYSEAEGERLEELLDDLVSEIREIDKYISIYGINSNEDQKCSAYIDDEYYTFEFTRGSDDYFYLNITALEDTPSDTIKVIGLSNLLDCKSENKIYKTKNSKKKIYLLNKGLSSLTDDEDSEEKAQKDLSNFYILVSSIKIEEYKNILSDIIINNLRK